MPASIGLRFYHITLKRSDGSPAGKSDFLELNEYIKEFAADNTSFSTSSELQRVFSFSRHNFVSSNVDISGYLRYGTFGFESDIIDTETAEVVHRRKVSDMEEIPLFFRFWFPEGADFALAAFQSFSGRSCKQMVVLRLYEGFNKKHENLRLSFRRVMPQEMRDTGFFASPVKEVTLLKKNVPRDRAGAYISRESSSEISLKISMVAKRNGTLGRLADIFGQAADAGESYLIFDDIEFDEARAVVTVGGRRRTVGLMGHNSDAGVIEISDDVDMGDDGHPKYESVSGIVDSILSDIYSYLSGAPK